MQSKKAPKKVLKAVDQAVPSAETTSVSEEVTKPVRAKSVRAKKTEVSETNVGSHHHKVAATFAADAPPKTKPAKAAAPVPVLTEQPKSIVDRPSRTIHTHEIAELAYSYFVKRGHAHGSAEQDWLQAERELNAR